MHEFVHSWRCSTASDSGSTAYQTCCPRGCTVDTRVIPLTSGMRMQLCTRYYDSGSRYSVLWRAAFRTENKDEQVQHVMTGEPSMP